MMNNRVEWKAVPGYKNEYCVSDNGLIWSIRSQKVLSPKKTSTGYFRVGLSVNGERHDYGIHRFVALAFIPNPEGKPTVNHLNEVKSDNCVQNLEWATTAEQNIHGTRIARAMRNTDWKKRSEKMDYKAIASKHDYHKMNKNQMKAVIQLDEHGFFIAKYNSLSEAAQVKKIRPSHLCSCLKGRRKTCGGYQWKYA